MLEITNKCLLVCLHLYKSRTFFFQTGRFFPADFIKPRRLRLPISNFGDLEESQLGGTTVVLRSTKASATVVVV